MRGTARPFWTLVAAAAAALLLVGSAGAAGTPAPGYAASDFATGFPGSGIGPIGIAFDPTDPTSMYVADYPTGQLYKFGPGGGAASAHLVGTVPGGVFGLAFDSSGRLYTAWGGSVKEIDKTNASIVRVVNPSVSGLGVAVDPVSGDLIVESGGLVRVNLTTGAATSYAPVGGDGITIGPDGSIYVASGGSQVVKVTPTNVSPTTWATVASVPSVDGVAIAASTDPGNPAFLFGNRNDGIITKVDLTTSPATQTDIVTGGTRGDFATVGFDGCFYGTQANSIVKVTQADGSCNLAPVTPDATTSLTWAGDSTQDYNDVATLAATLRDDTHGTVLAGKTVTFTLGSLTCSAVTDATGTASCQVTPNTAAGPQSATATFAHEHGFTASTVTEPFQVTLEQTTVHYTGPTGTFHVGQAVALSGTLQEDGTTAIAGRTLTLSLGSQSCSATTDATGSASCGVTAAGPSGSQTASASFAGDGYYAAGSDSTTVTVSAASKLTYTGPTSQDYADAATVSATLSDAAGGGPISGQTVTFTLGTASCSGTTDPAGNATCSLTPSSAAGADTLNVGFAGGGGWDPSSTASPFTVTREETTLAYTGSTAIAQGSPATLSGVLKEDGATGIAGRTVVFSLGAQSCSGVTDASGAASCVIASVVGPTGPRTVTASFGGDGYYVPASDSASALVYGVTAGGSFVVGDGSLTGSVEFWGAQWAKDNTLSGGAAPSAFKGFASNASLGLGAWTTSPGNSSAPPSSVPQYIAVIVSSSVTKDGSSISGNAVHVVVIRVDPGYAGNPGHAGTGTIVAQLS
ncbi:MAG TPA: hypothetical protein VNC40_06050 [Gaiellaceae bacterium]|nr:hypothetical protein [Gaiellaceae bacterium]